MFSLPRLSKKFIILKVSLTTVYRTKKNYQDWNGHFPAPTSPLPPLTPLP